MKTKGGLENEHDRPLEGTESNRACGMKLSRKEEADDVAAHLSN